MSAARRLLRMPLSCDDYALLGVRVGASGAEVTAALRTRLRAVDEEVGVPPDMVLNARRELQDAVRRILLAPAAAGVQSTLGSHPVSVPRADVRVVALGPVSSRLSPRPI